MNASGDRSMMAGYFIITFLLIVIAVSYATYDHRQIYSALNRLTLAIVTTEEDKKEAIGPNLRKKLKDELRETAEQAVEKISK